MRWLLGSGLVCLLAAACGGSDGGSPTNPSSPPSQPTTFALSGRVTESATSVPISGATVRVEDGASAGRSTTTDDGGNYRLADLQRGDFNVSASAQGFNTRAQGVSLTADRTLGFVLDPSGPRTRFGAGQHMVGKDIAPGRYFTEPDSGCYWERLRGLSGSLGDIIANEFIGFAARQWIVDIRPSDLAFETEADCNVWWNSPRHGPQSNIEPGVWLVGAQIQPGTYRATVQSGCYWERLRDFTGTLGAILANDFVSTPGPRSITIRSSDVGFMADEQCGPWARSFTFTEPGSDEPADQSASEIERRRKLGRLSHGR